VERLIGTLRREYLDHMLFWTTADLENKLLDFRTTSTTIARITHGKGERRIRPRHDQKPISARFDGNHAVEPSIRPRWLPNLSKTRARCAVSRPRQYSQGIHSVFLNRSAFRGSRRSLPQDTVRFPIQSAPAPIRQRQVSEALVIRRQALARYE
jgi:hypothetical protein